MKTRVVWYGRVYDFTTYRAEVCLGASTTPEQVASAEFFAKRALLEAHPICRLETAVSVQARGEGDTPVIYVFAYCVVQGSD